MSIVTPGDPGRLSARDHRSAFDSVQVAYGRALELLRPLWEFEPNRPRYVAKRIAVRLLELARRDGDLLCGVVLLRAQHASRAEVSLKVGCVLAALVGPLDVRPRIKLDAVVAGLLHQVGQDTHGAYAHDAGAQAQRSLLGILMTPTSDAGQYRQVLAAFQHQLGVDGTGVPRMDFPVRQHPLAALLAVALDFVELVTRGVSGRSAITAARALAELDAHAGDRYQPVLVHALARVFGPTPVGSMVAFADGTNAIVVAYHGGDAGAWVAEAVDVESPKNVLRYGRDLAPMPDAIYDVLPVLRSLD